VPHRLHRLHRHHHPAHRATRLRRLSVPVFRPLEPPCNWPSFLLTDRPPHLLTPRLSSLGPAPPGNLRSALGTPFTGLRSRRPRLAWPARLVPARAPWDASRPLPSVRVTSLQAPSRCSGAPTSRLHVPSLALGHGLAALLRSGWPDFSPQARVFNTLVMRRVRPQGTPPPAARHHGQQAPRPETGPP
jgi:hypothetical protein